MSKDDTRRTDEALNLFKAALADLKSKGLVDSAAARLVRDLRDRGKGKNGGSIRGS